MPATSPTKLLFTLARAAGKAATAKLRGVGMAAEAADWAVRAEICERCPLRVVKCGVSYCGQPLMRRIVRDPAVDGCGCPTRAKAKDPTEHCPITPRHEPSHTMAGPGVAGVIGCGCKWCHAARPQILPAAA
ncbi:MAG TPA: hypothetical protein VF595_04040 [Tepidisphaeraceae bacterium]|jgi:hypothetical protein